MLRKKNSLRGSEAGDDKQDDEKHPDSGRDATYRPGCFRFIHGIRE